MSRTSSKNSRLEKQSEKESTTSNVESSRPPASDRIRIRRGPLCSCKMLSSLSILSQRLRCVQKLRSNKKHVPDRLTGDDMKGGTVGHQRMGKLPATRKWDKVIALITGGADAAVIAAATAGAADQSLRMGSDDEALRHGFWLLTQIPLMARGTDFAAGLRNLGMEVSGLPTLVEITTALLEAIDQAAHRSGKTTDFSEMASKAAVESLSNIAGRKGEGLFGPGYAADEARAALAGLGTERQFGILARDYVSRLTRHCLDYFLSRELPNHVGLARRFQSIKDHDQFDKALGLHCRETSLIIERFAADWFSKTIYEGGITKEKAGGFVHVALNKVRDELRTRQRAHA